MNLDFGVFKIFLNCRDYSALPLLLSDALIVIFYELNRRVKNEFYRKSSPFRNIVAINSGYIPYNTL